MVTSGIIGYFGNLTKLSFAYLTIQNIVQHSIAILAPKKLKLLSPKSAKFELAAELSPSLSVVFQANELTTIIELICITLACVPYLAHNQLQA